VTKPEGSGWIQLRDPTTIPELLVVLDAVRGGAKLSPFRRLTVVCDRQHELAMVLDTTAGPVLVSEMRGRHGAIRLGELGDQDAVRVQCKCSTRGLWGAWLRWKLKNGGRVRWAD
jgi:hypothetical protein